jgi:hypothetical protein
MPYATRGFSSEPMIPERLFRLTSEAAGRDAEICGDIRFAGTGGWL